MFENAIQILKQKKTIIYHQIKQVSPEMDNEIKKKVIRGYWKKFDEYDKAINVLEAHSRHNQTVLRANNWS